MVSWKLLGSWNSRFLDKKMLLLGVLFFNDSNDYCKWGVTFREWGLFEGSWAFPSTILTVQHLAVSGVLSFEAVAAVPPT